MEEREKSEAAINFCKVKRAIKLTRPGSGGVERAILQSELVLSGREVTRLIRACRNSRQWQKALEILQTVRSGNPKVGSKANYYTYSAAISVCSKSGRLADSVWLLRAMEAAAEKDESIRPDSPIYRLILLCCVREKEVDLAMELILEVLEGGMELDSEVLEHAIMLSMEKEPRKRTIQMIDELHCYGAVLSAKCYNRFFKFCAAEGDVGAATEVFIMMQMMGVPPDPCDCHHLVHATLTAHCPEYGLMLLQDMCENYIRPLAQTYACIARCFVSNSNTNQLAKVLELMESHLCAWECDYHKLAGCA